MNWSKVKYFNPSEFVCQCGCGRGAGEMNEQFMLALDAARKEAGIPFRITSGFRCPSHNARVGGVKDSAHAKGLAADISIVNSAARVIILRALLRYFDRLGVGKRFVHVDMDPSRSVPVMWVY